MRTLLGVETEYAVTGWDERGHPYPRGLIVQAMLAMARERLPSLIHEAGHGVFLGNGSRFLLDAGLHPEYATSECRDPWEVLAQIRAGDRIVRDLADLAKEACRGLATVSVFRANTSPGPPPASWACHENYFCANQPPARLLRSLVPHLVSRVIFTGAGGFRPDRPTPEFTLSPRAWFLVQVRSTEATEDRGIFNLRDEPLSTTGYWLHVVAGESVCSDLAVVLKVGTTALVAALADAGLISVVPVRLANPVSALHQFASDPSCRVQVTAQSGRSISAIEIQRHYLDAVVAHLDILPAWAKAVSELWRTQLDQLEADPRSARTVDWVVKLAMLERLVRDRATREALFEFDARFGELGDRGIHGQLMAQGLLGDRQVTEHEVATAVTTPPRRTRAWQRGQWVRRLAAESPHRLHLMCDWDSICDPVTGQVVPFGDPFVGEGTATAWLDPERSRQLSFGFR